MANKYSTGISIDKELWERAKAFGESQFPQWTFSDVVTVALTQMLGDGQAPQPKRSDVASRELVLEPTN